MAEKLLVGRVAAITGSGSGIGRGIAQRLAAEGAIVAALDIDLAAARETIDIIRKAGGAGEAFRCDVSDEGSFRRAGKAVAADLGETGIVVNNAGFLRPAPLAELSLAQWNSVLSVNLTGAFLSTLVFGPSMRTSSRGVFVHVGSIASQFAQTRGGAYSASKAGICGLSATIAAEWGSDGIRSNVVHPGMIRTALSAAFYSDAELAKRREATVASRRTGVPDDIAGAVLFLASDLSAYVNGAELTVDGGFSRMAIDLIPRPGYETGS
ncbi:SDR family NAD(P)-dependent oxidoreductase [Mesorhizobium sp. ASY16-5R]|uniref:SDR family NAD(P)-dependent oxidoreductase n=1 Tax=Mesorhizobium sp. ASY16-5R TaxID=3445772 RepID=UPI003F9F678E